MKKYTVSQRLNQYMKKNNLRQIDILNKAKPFCEKYNIKIGDNDLSQYVNGKVTPSEKKLCVLSEALNINEVWLMGYDVPDVPKLSKTMFTNLNQDSNEIILYALEQSDISSIKELSHKINVPYDKLLEILSGKNKIPKPVILLKIAKELNIDIELLLITVGYIELKNNLLGESSLYNTGLRFLLSDEDRKDLCKILYDLWKQQKPDLTLDKIYYDIFHEQYDYYVTDEEINILKDDNIMLNVEYQFQKNDRKDDELEKLYTKYKDKLTESDKKIIKTIIEERINK